MTRRIGVTLFTAVLLSAAALFAVPGTVRATSCDSTFADARDFRRQLGFSTDADLIRSLANDPATDCTWGVPLTYDSSWLGPALVAFLSLALLAVRLGPRRSRRTTD